MTDGRKVLSPFNPREAITTAQAVERTGKAAGTIRYWCEKHGIGRKICGEMAVSRVALEMLLESDTAALRLYHSGERKAEAVARYFEQFGLR